MSKEFSILARCPHETKEERVILSDNRKYLIPQQPIASTYSVRIIVNNDPNLRIPQSGLKIPAQLTSGNSGPFNIKAGSNVLNIKTKDSNFVVNLPTGKRVSTDNVIRQIRSVTTDIGAGNVNGHIYLADLKNIGKSSRIKVSGSVTSELGFDLQSGSRGRELFPSWRVVRDPDTDARFIAFKRNVKNNPIFKVSYSVSPEFCLRCGGSFVENDYAFDINGQAILIENENLLNQAAVKIVFTLKGSNPFHPFYGTNILNRIGTKALSSVANIINEDVRRALSAMQRLQREQAKYQPVSFKEQLLSIESVQTIPDPEDPTVFDVDIVLRNASNEPIKLTVFFTVPQVISRMAESQLRNF